jgi:hypothetical protein
MKLPRHRFLCVASALAIAATLAGCSSSPDSAATSAQPKSGGLLSRITESTKPVTIPEGTSLRVVLDQSISSKDARSGDSFNATVVEPVVIQGKTVVPRDAHVKGHVVDAQASGRLQTPARLALALDSVEVNGKSYDLQSSTVSRAGSSHKTRDIEFIGGGAGLGALIGGLAGHGKGAAIGAAAGAGAGTAAAAATGKKDITLPAESTLSFRLTQPLTIEVKS